MREFGKCYLEYDNILNECVLDCAVEVLKKERYKYNNYLDCTVLKESLYPGAVEHVLLNTNMIKLHIILKKSYQDISKTACYQF